MKEDSKEEEPSSKTSSDKVQDMNDKRYIADSIKQHISSGPAFCMWFTRSSALKKTTLQCHRTTYINIIAIHNTGDSESGRRKMRYIPVPGDAFRDTRPLPYFLFTCLHQNSRQAVLYMLETQRSEVIKRFAWLTAFGNIIQHPGH